MKIRAFKHRDGFTQNGESWKTRSDDKHAILLWNFQTQTGVMMYSDGQVIINAFPSMENVDLNIFVDNGWFIELK